mmetsp:Transcript_14033/g.30799  ORF Transcript_14033/g.30799 Transcript_14033/m.30799 type:complete len:227 (+) Transcript_14033:1880-2560(+)
MCHTIAGQHALLVGRTARKHSQHLYCHHILTEVKPCAARIGERSTSSNSHGYVIRHVFLATATCHECCEDVMCSESCIPIHIKESEADLKPLFNVGREKEAYSLRILGQPEALGEVKECSKALDVRCRESAAQTLHYVSPCCCAVTVRVPVRPVLSELSEDGRNAFPLSAGELAGWGTEVSKGPTLLRSADGGLNFLNPGEARDAAVARELRPGQFSLSGTRSPEF